MSTQPKVNSILSRRYIVGAVIGAAVGIFGRLGADFYGLHPRSISEEGIRSEWIPGCMPVFEQLRIVATGGEGQHILKEQLYLLLWLKDRGDIAARTAVLAALLLASSVYAVDRLKEKRAARKAQEQA